MREGGRQSCTRFLPKRQPRDTQRLLDRLRALFDYVDDKTYGAFSWGDTRFVMLDCGEDKPDSTWVYYGLNDFTGLRKDQVSFLSKELSGKEFKQASKRVY